MSDPIRLGIIGLDTTTETLFHLLSSIDSLSIRLADTQRGLLQLPQGDFVAVNSINAETVAEFVANHDVIVCRCPFFLTSKAVTEAAGRGIIFINASTDRATSFMVTEFTSKAAVVGQCGVRDIVRVLAKHVGATVEDLDTISVRMGHLPLYPQGRLGVGRDDLDALIETYLGTDDQRWHGRKITVPALSDVEDFILDGAAYESFTISDQSNQLLDYFAGIRNVSFKTIAHRGHAEAMKVLLDDLRLRDDPIALFGLLDRALSTTSNDCLIISIAATGTSNGIAVQENYVRKFLPTSVAGFACRAVDYAEASLIASMVDLAVTGEIVGTIRLEDIELSQLFRSKYSKSLW